MELQVALIGLAGVGVGALITLVAEWLRLRHETDLDGVKRRNDRWIEQNRDQRTALSQLQQAVAALVAYWAGGPINDGQRSILRLELARSASLVMDESTRDIGDRMLNLEDQVRWTGEQLERGAILESFRTAADQLIAKAGDLIRQTYVLEPPAEPKG